MKRDYECSVAIAGRVTCFRVVAYDEDGARDLALNALNGAFEDLQITELRPEHQPETFARRRNPYGNRNGSRDSHGQAADAAAGQHSTFPDEPAETF